MIGIGSAAPSCLTRSMLSSMLASCGDVPGGLSIGEAKTSFPR